MNNKQFLSFEEAAKYVSVSRSTIYRWTHTRDLHYIRVGNVSRIDRDELDRFMRSPEFRM
ncbi:helix-turn-helix domain-containing protein [Limosilactobacillus reuteri]|uniref:helix-turn-helix domain-containing protein n=1 Tax=Limosilactobacillus reuteri TaxID=1598 RepID=UPI003B66EB44